jgi:Tol biopolymer transport system component
VRVATTGSSRYNTGVLRGSRLVLAVLAGLLLVFLPRGGPAHAAFFGANGLLAYTCGSDICVATSGGGSTQFITGGSDPVWSPNGSKIAWVDDTTSKIEVQSVSNGALTGSVVDVTSGSSAQPTWSSTGLQIAYLNTTDNKIYVSNADGSGGATAVAAPASTPTDPAWSPDGTDIAYARQVSGRYQIFDVPISVVGGVFTGGTEVQLTNTGDGDNRHPGWSPFSDTIVFSSTQGGPTATPLLWTMPFDGTSGQSETRLGSGIPGDMPSYSPDETKIAFSVPAGATGAGALQTVNATGAGSTTTIDDGSAHGTTSDPDWQATSSFSTGGTGPPVNTSYPTIILGFGSTDNAPTVGRIVSATIGAWTGSFPITYAFQWKKCVGNDPLNGPCYEIPGATSALLIITPDLYGMRLRVAVTATNSLGSKSQNSESSAVVTAQAPHQRASPPIAGANVVGQTISAGIGVWDGTLPLTYTYQWKRCNPPGDLDSCVPIPGATQSTYIPTPDDIGFTLRVFVTATNFIGSDTQFSNHTFPIIDRQHFAPSTLVAPGVTGTAQLGRTLTADSGSFDGDTPISTTLRWQRCDATGAACRNIARATKRSYAPTAVDLGSTLRVAVTATNAYGKFVSVSQPTEPVIAQLPHRKGLRIVGTAKSDYLFGTPRDDTILGGGGNDTITGDAGYDKIYGGAGNDVITVTGPGGSHVYGGPGSDTIYAQDGFRDVIDCGPGRDRAVVDSIDVVKKTCEVVDTTPLGTGPSDGGSSGSGPGLLPGSGG